MLSDSKLKSHFRKPQSKQLVLSDRDGLYARISKVGGISFFIRYRYAGKQEQLTIGTYPEISLKDARDKNLHYRAIIIDGKNPKIQKKLELKKTHDAMTFDELIELWYEKEAIQKKKRHVWILRTIQKHMYPAFKGVPVEDITIHHFFDVFDRIAKISPHQVQNLISNTRQALSLAVRRRIISDNPLIGISSNRDFNIEKNEIDRSLNDDELELLLTFAFHDASRTGAIVLLALLFGCRMGEIGSAKIEHFDFFNMLWTVPPENHKTGKKIKRPIVRPIIKEIVPFIEMLMAMSDDDVHLLTNPRTGGKLNSNFWTHHPKTINKWLERNGHKKIEHWTMHDLRRTQRTNMSTIAEPHVCEIMLGHKLPGVWQVYDKHLYLDEQKKAYTEWWHRLKRINSNESNVVTIDDKRAI